MALSRNLPNISNKFTFYTPFYMIFVSNDAHISLKNSFSHLGLPCVFCLLVSKKGVTYRHIFAELKDIATRRNKTFAPQIIMSDFETGVLPVIKSEVSI